MYGHLDDLRTKLRPQVSFSDEAWTAASDLFSQRCFAAGAHVIEAGQVVTQLHFLVSGIAR